MSLSLVSGGLRCTSCIEMIMPGHRSWVSGRLVGLGGTVNARDAARCQR